MKDGTAISPEILVLFEMFAEISALDNAKLLMKGYFVQVANLGNGSGFHVYCKTFGEVSLDCFPHSRYANELITATD